MANHYIRNYLMVAGISIAIVVIMFGILSGTITRANQCNLKTSISAEDGVSIDSMIKCASAHNDIYLMFYFIIIGIVIAVSAYITKP